MQRALQAPILRSRLSTAVAESVKSESSSGGGGGASFMQKLLAFSGGAAVGSLYYLFTVQESWKNDDALALEVKMLRKETLKTSVEFRERVALLEHEVVNLKKELAAWERGKLGRS